MLRETKLSRLEEKKKEKTTRGKMWLDAQHAAYSHQFHKGH